MTAPKVLLFDLGGVVIEVDFRRAFDHWGHAAGVDPDRIAERYLPDEAYERHERGELSSQDYFAHLRDRLGLDLPDADMAEGWNRILPGEIPGMAAVLRGLEGRIPLYLFSNTNPAHAEFFTQRFGRLLNHFDGIFLSSDLGHRKPEKHAFEAVCSRIGVHPRDVLFFDDSDVNVVGARKAGLHAAHVPRHADLLRVLAEHGF